MTILPASASENAEWLRSQFAGLVRSCVTGPVLDVGCGGGAVIELLRAGGADAVGVEEDPAVVESLRARGLRAEVATAEALPFTNRSFAWVVMRHVPHHLADERVAFAEALRVARDGVVVAEPRFDPGIPSQHAAERFDEWLKELHRRTGRVHRPNLCSATLIDSLAAVGARLDFETHAWLRLRERPLADLDAEAEAALAEVGTAADRAAYASLRREIEMAGGVTWNGSSAVVATVRRC